MGIFGIFIRFIVKFLRKHNTYYAVTDKRVLILTNMFRQHLQAFSVHNLPTLEKWVITGDIGTIIFVEAPPNSYRYNHREIYAKTGMETIGSLASGFYDIHEVDEVYRIITLQTSYASVEQSKPTYLPR